MLDVVGPEHAAFGGGEPVSSPSREHLAPKSPFPAIDIVLNTGRYLLRQEGGLAFLRLRGELSGC
ncbi:MAG: hypothetical protein ACKPKO_27155, partial [Candidatus Fonsibacter sp.]